MFKQIEHIYNIMEIETINDIDYINEDKKKLIFSRFYFK